MDRISFRNYQKRPDAVSSFFKKGKKKKKYFRDLECWVATNYRTSLLAPFRDWNVWGGSFCLATSWATRRAWKFSIVWHRYVGCKRKKKKDIVVHYYIQFETWWNEKCHSFPSRRYKNPSIVWFHLEYTCFLCAWILEFFFRDLSHNNLDLGSDNVFPHLESLLDLYVYCFKFDKLSPGSRQRQVDL
jgi:hypothetical protein